MRRLRRWSGTGSPRRAGRAPPSRSGASRWKRARAASIRRCRYDDAPTRSHHHRDVATRDRFVDRIDPRRVARGERRRCSGRGHACRRGLRRGADRDRRQGRWTCGAAGSGTPRHERDHEDEQQAAPCTRAYAGSSWPDGRLACSDASHPDHRPHRRAGPRRGVPGRLPADEGGEGQDRPPRADDGGQGGRPRGRAETVGVPATAVVGAEVAAGSSSSRRWCAS